MSYKDTPFERMDRMMDEMNRRFAAMNWNDWQDADWRMPALESGSDGRWDHSEWDTTLNVERDAEGFTVLADTPGFERDELDVRFHDGTLHIGGTHEDDHEGFHSRRFSREVSLDGDVLEDEITAHYHNGVLEIRVPTEDTPEVIDEGRRIEIED